jgi:hypothetical protein
MKIFKIAVHVSALTLHAQISCIYEEFNMGFTSKFSALIFLMLKRLKPAGHVMHRQD